MTSLAAQIADSPAAMLAIALEVILKGTLMLAVAALAVFTLRRATASLRHTLWSFALVAMLAIPALTLVLPRWQMGVIPVPTGLLTSDARSTSDAAAYPPDDRYVRDGRDAVSDGSAPAVAGPSTGLAASHVGAAATISSPSANSTSAGSLASSLALLWIGGIAAGLITIFGGMLALRKLSRDAEPLDSNEWTTLTAELSAGLGITRAVRVMRSDSATMPATWGVRRPVILLPAAAESWTDERRRVVLLHELAHVRRNDSLMQIVAQICCAVYWFHPGVWYTARQLRTERELACDEHVLGIGINACDYAAHLLEIARVFRTPADTSVIAVAMARPSQLEARVRAILEGDVAGRMRTSRAARLAAVAVLTVMLLPLAAMRPWRDAIPPIRDAIAPAAEIQQMIIGGAAGDALVAASDTFRWRGVVPSGKWVEVLSVYGDIRAEPASGRDVEIFAIRKSGDGRRLRIGMERTDGGARFCAILASSESAKPCAIETNGRLSNGLSDVRVDFLVKVPAGVGIAAHTARGNIVAESMKSYVWGTSGQGDIRITTTDLAEASTRVGSIFAQFGRRSWRQDLEFFTENGDVTVVAPRDASMMVQAMTGYGRIRSDFPGTTRALGAGEERYARIGTGRGMLTLRTGRGTLELKRGGPATGETSDMAISYSSAPSSRVDPKPNANPDPADDPNPNPDPGYDPDPNENPDVEERRKAGESGAEGDKDNPTGERVDVTIPKGLIARFNDAALRGMSDAQAIARLRDIAASHVKQHPADFVKERSEWALTLVRNGSIVIPLRNALSSRDWRERAYAAWALGETRDPRATDALTAALGDSHWRVRMHAAAGLQRLGGARAVEPLIEALADNFWQVRISAVDALGAIGDRRAVPSLTQVAERDPRPFVRDEARNALQRIR